jgi:hypothetical protein
MQQTHNRMSAMHKSTYRGDVKDKTYREDGNYAKNVLMSTPHYPRDRQSDTIGRDLYEDNEGGGDSATGRFVSYDASSF